MKRKRIKEKITRIFQELSEGDRVSVIREISEVASFPKKIQGRTGTIEKRRGKAYIVKISDGNKIKEYIIEPVHLKKLK